jgi:hypothetical protein
MKKEQGEGDFDRRTVLVSFAGLTGAGLLYGATRNQVATGAMAASGPAAPALPSRKLPASRGLTSVTAHQLPLGGGGFVTGLDISSNGELFVCRTDVANAYVRRRGDRHWSPLFSPATMQPDDYDPLPKLNDKADGQGVAGVRIAPSDRNTIYASYYGYVWKSLDGGRTIRRTRLPQSLMPSNRGEQRLHNPTLDVAPRNPLHVMVATYGEGAWGSEDGGERWKRLALPQPGKSLDNHAGLTLVRFDPAQDGRVYAFVAGVGLHRTDGGLGSEFKRVEGGPLYCSSLVADRKGILYLCEETAQNAGKLWRYDPAAGWSSAMPNHQAKVVAVDPHRDGRLILCNPYGFFMESLDSGQTFAALEGAAWGIGGEVAWTNGLGTLFPAELKFDPEEKGVLWTAQGVGVARTEATGKPYRFSDWSAGIEELCIFSITTPPGGRPVAAAWDKPFWRIDSTTSHSNDFRYPVRPGKKVSASVNAFASSIDFAGDDPRFLVGVVTPGEDAWPGYSEDGGTSWQAFAGMPSSGWGAGGWIAASTRKNFVLLPSNNAAGAFTLDGGRNWSPIKLDGINVTDQFANASYVKRKNIATDKTRSGVFALVYTTMQNNQTNNPLGGIWLTEDGGKSWRQMLKGVVASGSNDPTTVRARGQDERQYWQCQLEFVPGFRGELVYTPHADFKDDRFYWSRDYGSSWSELHRDIRNVGTFGFGKAAPGQKRPALYFWGMMDGREGLYVSFDWCATKPTLITSQPSAMLAWVSWVSPDPDVFGRVYVGTSCAGVTQVDVTV